MIFRHRSFRPSSLKFIIAIEQALSGVGREIELLESLPYPLKSIPYVIPKRLKHHTLWCPFPPPPHPPPPTGEQSFSSIFVPICSCFKYCAEHGENGMLWQASYMLHYSVALNLSPFQTGTLAKLYLQTTLFIRPKSSTSICLTSDQKPRMGYFSSTL